MTVMNGLVAAAIVFVATGGNALSWLVVLAAPAVLLLTLCFTFLWNLATGWNRLWWAEWAIAGDNGEFLNLWFWPKNRIFVFSRPAIDTRVRSPDGAWHLFAADTHSLGGKYYATYPVQFNGSPVVPGTYTVVWLEETTGSGWKEVLSHRVKVPRRPDSA